MAKAQCPNCGHKNKSSASICASCGNFLLDSEFSMQATENKEPVDSPKAYDATSIVTPDTNQSADVIKVLSKKGIYSWLPTVIPFGVIAVFIALEYSIKMPTYSFIPFLLIILFLPSFLRKSVMGIQFFSGGFRILGSSRPEAFAYNNIESIHVKSAAPGIQPLTIFFKGSEKPITLEFDSVQTFRMMVMQLNRRRIPIITEDTVNKEPDSGTP